MRWEYYHGKNLHWIDAEDLVPMTLLFIAGVLIGVSRFQYGAMHTFTTGLAFASTLPIAKGISMLIKRRIGDE
jgi:hypothetical protein